VTQGQKVKGQLAGGGGILWRPPAQLVYIGNYLEKLIIVSYVQAEYTSFLGIRSKSTRCSYIYEHSHTETFNK